MALSAIINAFTGNRAARQQSEQINEGIFEQRRQFDLTRQTLSPFISAGAGALAQFQPYQQTGTQALDAIRALSGLSGYGQQQQAVSAIERSPLFGSLAKQGEEAILQRASATGGLRGGNVQAALAQFRPAMLQQLIEQQYARLGGLAGSGLSAAERLAGFGQSSAAMQGQIGGQSAQNLGSLYGQLGQSKAGGTLAVGRAVNEGIGDIAKMFGGF